LFYKALGSHEKGGMGFPLPVGLLNYFLCFKEGH
jgi:hypothetical protein